METLGVLLLLVAIITIVVGIVFIARAKTRKKGVKVLFISIAASIVASIMISAGGNDDNNDSSEEEVASTEANEESGATITKEQYESINIGDTQEKIEKEIGKTTDGNIQKVEDKTMWVYSGNGDGLAYIYFSNEDQKVVQKEEIGILSEDSSTETTSNEIEDLNDWKTQVKDIATSEKSKTEKFDAVSQLASSYSLSDDESKEFESYIINEFKNKTYLKDINNDQYMLSNIFKSAAVEKHYQSSGETAMGDFAFDFLQNTKYTYRGVDTVDSQPVLANEKQMNDALAKLQ
ncbi:DUF4064 domain-containing protein [Priestia filamentosa]|uniref:DUF4064 domain-containing protein n=1 Tax=Priestia filamentosa TaxID=1402861 RepID=UPI0039821ACE